jgi:hypothetical protein
MPDPAPYDAPTAERIAGIRALLARILVEPDVVVRNRVITLAYRNVSESVADVLGRSHLNWFSFGAWASGTAGGVMRGEGIPIDLGTTDGVAAGNLAIIEDVAPPILRWLDEIAVDGAPTPGALERTLADPRVAAAPQLGEAIRCYHAVAAHRTSPDAEPLTEKQEAELMLLGNVLFAAHEQHVADRFIDAAMPLGGPFGLITTRFVSIVTPDGPLDVCRDVVAPGYLAPDLFPIELAELQHPELCALCERFEQSTSTESIGSRAWSWEDYDERMGFILTFFRAYQRDARYFDVPLDFLPPQSA